MLSRLNILKSAKGKRLCPQRFIYSENISCNNKFRGAIFKILLNMQTDILQITKCGAEQNLRQVCTYIGRHSAAGRKRFLSPSHPAMTFAQICRFHLC